MNCVVTIVDVSNTFLCPVNEKVAAILERLCKKLVVTRYYFPEDTLVSGIVKFL
jgi:hypothetical protein